MRAIGSLTRVAVNGNRSITCDKRAKLDRLPVELPFFKSTREISRSKSLPFGSVDAHCGNSIAVPFEIGDCLLGSVDIARSYDSRMYCEIGDSAIRGSATGGHANRCFFAGSKPWFGEQFSFAMFGRTIRSASRRRSQKLLQALIRSFVSYFVSRCS